MSLNNGFAMDTINRLPNVLTASGHRTGVQRTAITAENLSKRNVFLAKAKLMHNALVRCVQLAYETFPESNLLANVDYSGRILVPVPWSRSNYKTYGLRRTEADALRLEMLSRNEPENADPALFVYLSEFRSWYVDLHAYPTMSDAAHYVKTHPVTWKTLIRYQQVR